MQILSENSQITQLNEMMVQVKDSLPTEIEQSVYYAKLKQLLHPEIYNFCKEKIELKQDLNFLRMKVGEKMTEKEIREYLDSLKLKYNGAVDDIGIDYAIEVTRVDYGVPVFVVIKRNEISMKKFVFRFRKINQEKGIGNLTVSGLPLDALKGGDNA